MDHHHHKRQASKHLLPYPALAVVGDEVELVAGLEGEAEAEQEGVVQRGQDAALRERVADLYFISGKGCVFERWQVLLFNPTCMLFVRTWCRRDMSDFRSTFIAKNPLFSSLPLLTLLLSFRKMPPPPRSRTRKTRPKEPWPITCVLGFGGTVDGSGHTHHNTIQDVDSDVLCTRKRTHLDQLKVPHRHPRRPHEELLAATSRGKVQRAAA